MSVVKLQQQQVAVSHYLPADNQSLISVLPKQDHVCSLMINTFLELVILVLLFFQQHGPGSSTTQAITQ